MKYLKFLMFPFLFSCVRVINPPIRVTNPILVVEGWITTDPGPYFVRLSYSGQFAAAYQLTDKEFISDAQVSIADDLGDSTSCSWVSDGTYQSTDSAFTGTPGRSYRLTVRLADGKIYTSSPEKIEPVPPIDSLSVVYDSTYITDVRPTQLIVSVHTHDVAGTHNYYRWTASGYIPRRSSGAPCSLGSPPCGSDCVCYAFCVQYLTDDRINVFSDRFTDGSQIVQQVFYSPLYWKGVHFIQVNQFSISQETYAFWQAFLEQTNRTGSTLDPLPAPLKGNVYNVADSGDRALGLFSASMVSTKKVKITPDFLQEYYLRSIAGSYIKQGDCQYVFPNTLGDGDSPPGWENAEAIEMK